MDNSALSTGTTAPTINADRNAVTRWAKKLESAAALDILQWGVEQFGSKLTFATGFGPEGCVLIDLISRNHLKVDVFSLDTGLLFDETYELWRNLEEHYDVKIRGVVPLQSVDAQAAVHGDSLWERAPDQCCELRKVMPLRNELSKVDAWITAIRREQTAQRANAPVVEWDAKFGIAKINPLVRWTKKEVWSHILKYQVPYNPLHDRGYPSIGCTPCTSTVKSGEDDRAGRWRGVAKTECGLHGPAVPMVEQSKVPRDTEA